MDITEDISNIVEEYEVIDTKFFGIFKSSVKTYIVKEEIEYVYFEDQNVKIGVRVPKGYITDLMTVPPFLRFLFPEMGGYDKAAIIHDVMYTEKKMYHLDKGCVAFIASRKFSDKLMFSLCNDLGVKHWRSALIYQTLRIFGGWYWKNS